MVDRKWNYKTARKKSHYIRNGLKDAKIDPQTAAIHTQRFYSMWLHNMNVYKHKVKGMESLQELYGTWNDKPILICGNGPSLHANLDNVKLAQESGFKIIGVDSAFKALKRADIKPDLTFSTDAQQIVSEFFDDCVEEDDNFALCLTTDYSVYEKVKKGNVWFYSFVNHQGGISDVIVPLNYPLKYGCVRSLSVVTGNAIDAAMWLGGQPIATIGNDLCWYSHDSIPQFYIDNVPIFRMFRVPIQKMEQREAIKQAVTIVDGKAELFFTPESFMANDDVVRFCEPTDMYTIRGFIAARHGFQIWPVLYPDGDMIKDDIKFIDCSGGLVRGWETSDLGSLITGVQNEKSNSDSCYSVCAVG